MVRTSAIASLVGALVLAAPGLALAGSGGSAGTNRSTSSIALAKPDAGSVAASDTSWPRYGDIVTFDVSTTETPYPYVDLKCYQNGKLVGEGWDGFFDGALGDRLFGLYSPSWTGGAADCTAWLDKYVNGRWRQLASTSFHVAE